MNNRLLAQGKLTSRDGADGVGRADGDDRGLTGHADADGCVVHQGDRRARVRGDGGHRDGGRARAGFRGERARVHDAHAARARCQVT